MCSRSKILFTSGLIWLSALTAWAQTPPPATGSLAGQIKLGDKGAPGVTVALTAAEQRGQGAAAAAAPGQDPAAAARAVTDGEGRFQINNLAAGRYRVNVLAPGYVVAGNPSVQVADGQALDNVNFNLTKGGVITGKVTADGNRAVIGEPVTLTPLDENGQPARQPWQSAANFRTDDRGIYRLYGVPTGRYLVSVGRGAGPGGFGGGPPGRFNGGARTWQRTYYPEAVDVAQASPVELTAGSEVTGIDIRLVTRATYAITGRVVDEAGNPVAGVLLGHGRLDNPAERGGRGNAGNQGNRANAGNAGNSANAGNRANQNRRVVVEESTDSTSDAQGEFKIEGLLPGSYAVYIAQDRANPSEFYSEPVTVEVASSDASGIEVKLQGAASLSGVVVFEGANDPKLLANLPNLRISASARGGGGGGGVIRTTNATATVAPNGVFRVTGLSPGMVNLNVNDQRGSGSGMTLLRIERDGADARNGLRVGAGEQVAGVRLVVAYGSSVVRGLVQVEGGTLTPNLRLMAMARRVDSGSGRGAGGGGAAAQVDPSGRFQIERLVAGSYEISVQLLGGPGGRSGAATQTVVVGDNAVQNVVIPLNLATLQTETQRGGRRGQNQPIARPRGGRP